MSRLFNGSTTWLTGTNTISAFPLTLACWFNSSAGGQQALVQIVSPAASNMYLSMNVNSGVQAISQFGVGSANATTGSYTTGVWNHAGAVWTAANNRTAYLNGSGANNGSSVNFPTSPVLLAVGAYRDSSPDRVFSGLIAEVGVWTAALTAQEMGFLAAGVSPMQIRPASLYGYYPLYGDRNITELSRSFGPGPVLAVTAATGGPAPPNAICLRRRENMYLAADTADTAVYDESMLGGAEAGGDAVRQHVYSPVITGGAAAGGIIPFSYFVDVSGGAGVGGSAVNLLDLSLNFSGGAAASGSAVNWLVIESAAEIAAVSCGGVVTELVVSPQVISLVEVEAGGQATSSVGRTKQRLPKFDVGQVVYVPCAFLQCYVSQRIRGIEKAEKTFIYDLGLGWFQESVLLSVEDYHG